MKKYYRRVVIWVSLLGCIVAAMPRVAEAKDSYPKLANYYLDFFRPGDYDQLAKWDLLVLQAEMPSYNPSFFDLYRRKKPDGILVPYIYPAMFYEESNPGNYGGLPLRKYVLDEINAHDWWLKTASGGKIYGWPQLRIVNVTDPAWQDFNVAYLRDKLGMGQWDGVMYDMVDAEIGHYSSNIDIDGDGRSDPQAVVNSRWQAGMEQLFAKTRSMLGNGKLIVTNGNSIEGYQQNINGRIFENFPTPWEGNGSWQATMYQYLRRLPKLNRPPAVYIINATTANTGNWRDFRRMRFGLTSALLGDGYFSFDFGDQSHQQLWWYDEYDVSLGHAQSAAYNLLDPENDYVRAGLWRRDFDDGVAIVNSTTKEQLYVFKHEEFEKIRGGQDPNVNSGAKINYIRLAPNDGVILRRIQKDLSQTPFANGDFMRVFNGSGQQQRNGFFAYKADVAAGAWVMLTDLDNNGVIDRVVEQGGRLLVSGPGRKTISIAPFGPSFKGKISLAVYDLNADGSKEIIAAPANGTPQVAIYSQTGRLLSNSLFAFDKKFRGGVSIAAGDLNNDGKGEIVVGSGKGLAPVVKIFTPQGKLVGSVQAYDKNFRGGVNVAIGDIDNDGKNELITGPMSGGPHVRIFSSSGQLRGQFMAFDPNGQTGVRVAVGDVDGDGKMELLAGTTNF